MKRLIVILLLFATVGVLLYYLVSAFQTPQNIETSQASERLRRIAQIPSDIPVTQEKARNSLLEAFPKILAKVSARRTATPMATTWPATGPV